jgi:bifunctional non-homologous end joining protein LigD
VGLLHYKKKRKFSDTPEPAGGKASKKKGLIFVVQRHKATRLHYDFRLEVDGVLKSWAVPKGPSMNPADRRLAMMVEDHPFEYKDFAGVIPEGNYGAGIVEIWDHGTLTDIEGSPGKDSEKKLRAGLKSGDLKFTLKGRKLKGEFVLVRMRTAGDNAWLLIKHRDAFAIDKPYDSEKLTPAASPINKWLRRTKGAQPPAKKRAVKKRAGKKVATRRKK